MGLARSGTHRYGLAQVPTLGLRSVKLPLRALRPHVEWTQYGKLKALKKVISEKNIKNKLMRLQSDWQKNQRKVMRKCGYHSIKDKDRTVVLTFRKNLHQKTNDGRTDRETEKQKEKQKK